MVKLKDIYEYIDSFAPFDTAFSYDNVGILVGNKEKEIKKAMLTLDITQDTVKEAYEKGADVIISHHPVIFNAIKSLSEEDTVYLLAKYEIAALCAHTNLDFASEGVNKALFDKLELREVKGSVFENGIPQILLGKLKEEMTSEEFAYYVKEKLECGAVKYTESNKKINTVGICAGAGTEYMNDAYSSGADAFVTSECKHHELLEAKKIKLTLVDAGHFSTENIVIKPLCENLSKKFGSVEFIISETFADPVKWAK